MTTETNSMSALAFISSAMAFQSADETLRTAQALRNFSRQEMMPFLKAHQSDKWTSLGKEIKDALTIHGTVDKDGNPIESQPTLNNAQVTSWLGVFKTCFEYRILPTDSNADRLRKAKTWTNWTGSTVPNTYGKVHAPKPTEAPKVETLPTQDAPKTVQTSVKVQAPKPASVTVTHEEELTPFDVWNQYFERFVEHGVTHHYLGKLAGLMKVQPDALLAMMKQAQSDLNDDAQRLLAKK